MQAAAAPQRRAGHGGLLDSRDRRCVLSVTAIPFYTLSVDGFSPCATILPAMVVS